MLKKAISKLAKDDKPMLHSDQGWQYRMDEYCKVLKDRGIKQSMSREGNCYDNAPTESFFAVLKSESFHTRKFDSIEELKVEIIDYIEYYNHERIRVSLGGMSPVQYRQQYAKAP